MTSSQAFILARDHGCGDYYHGQTISYYDTKGHLVKTDHRNVLLWANSGKPFNKETWKTFVPRYVMYVDEDGKVIPKTGEKSEHVKRMDRVRERMKNIDPPPKTTGRIPYVFVTSPKKSNMEVLQQSIQPPPKKQKIMNISERSKMKEDTIRKNIFKNNNRQAIDESLIESVNELKVDEEQSDIQEFYVKEISKNEVDPVSVSDTMLNIEKERVFVKQEKLQMNEKILDLPPKKKPKNTKKKGKVIPKTQPRRNPPRKARNKNRKNTKSTKKGRKGRKGKKGKK